MSIIKCKMCGGDIEFTPGATYGTCEYCGSTSTIPKADDENKLNRYNRANHFRRQCEFDKAVAAYEKLLEQDDTDAEAHWGAVLSRYGIEYVEDPATKKRIPTCHRVQMASILADADYKAAVEHAPDAESRRLYEDQAAQIAEIQKGILAVSANEKPYDVFICYKETDEIGQRTHDSQWAQDVYYGLTEQGYKVFFARITLEDKLGQQYEPYIFAALNSAKVMVVIGSKPEYFNAVWVKNEWSRYLALMAKDRTRLLIPCYRGMDPYDLPEELSNLQSQDMSKIGFMQDLIRGISKVLTTEKPQQATPAAAPAGVAVPVSTAAPLLRRAFMFLEDGDWEKADEFCEQVLNLEPENAEAYLGKLMVQLRVTARKALADCSHESNITKSSNYEKACRFDKKLAAELQGYIDAIKTRNEAERVAGIYETACNEMKRARSEGDYKGAAKLFESIADHKDSAKLAQECRDKAEISRKDEIYRSAGNNMSGNNANSWEYAIRLFKSIPGWKDADAKVAECENKIAELKAKEEAYKKEKERQAQLAREKAAKEAKRKKTLAVVASVAAVIVAAVVYVMTTIVIPNQKYDAAMELMAAGEYEEAIAAFLEIETYKDSVKQIGLCKYNLANDYEADGNKSRAAMLYYQAGDIKDARERSFALWDEIAVRDIISAGRYHNVGLKADGSVIAVGLNEDGQCDTRYWQDIIAVSAELKHTIGLKADGTVHAVGKNHYGECNVSSWQDIVAISTNSFHTVGLKADGTVVATGNNNDGECNVSAWQDIVAISAGYSHTVGLKADGTVVAVGSNGSGQCNVSEWQDIVAISAGHDHTVGLKADGTVVAAGHSYDEEVSNVRDWQNIVAISAGDSCTFGIRADGSVVAAGQNYGGRCRVDHWSNIVAIGAGANHTIGLTANGRVLFVGDNYRNLNGVVNWQLATVPRPMQKK